MLDKQRPTSASTCALEMHQQWQKEVVLGSSFYRLKAEVSGTSPT